MIYDASRMANFGRDTAKSYSAFLRAEKKLSAEVNAAIEDGVKPLKVAHDLMGRCGSHEERINLLSALIALSKMGHIPESVVEPFDEGLKPRRV